MNNIEMIGKFTFRLLSAFLLMAGLEELIRNDVASSDLAGFLLIMAGTALAFASRLMKPADVREPASPSILRLGNPVLSYAIRRKSGQLGISVFISGAALSILAAAIMRGDIYSIVLFSGFGLLPIGLIWVLVVTVMSAVEVFRDLTGKERGRSRSRKRAQD